MHVHLSAEYVRHQRETLHFTLKLHSYSESVPMSKQQLKNIYIIYLK